MLRARWIAGAVTLIAWMPIAAAQEARVAYTLTDEPGTGSDAGAWRVEIVVDGLETEGGAAGFVSRGWGWPQDPSYLELVASEPSIVGRTDDGSTVTLEVPEPWNGRARIVYRIHLAARGSEAHRRNGLRPTRGGGYAFGYSLNALLQPVQAGRPFDAQVVVEVVAAKPDEVIVTGWGGRAQGRQRVEPDVVSGNAPIAFGEPRAMAEDRSEGFVVETFQFSRGRDVTPRVLELIRTLAPAIARATGRPARSPSRAFLTDAMDGGMGSDYGLHLSVRPDAPEGHEYDPGFATIAAHELFHEWLGIRLHGASEALTWVHEGFTEYFALWLTASTGIATREYFADTLTGYDRFARESTSFGRVAFGDASVDWRDGDGPNELMAYRGAPVLALALDVELRARGHPGLLALVRDLFESELYGYSLEDLHGWFVLQGLEASWDASVAGLDVPAAPDALLRAGFESTDVTVDVAYLGLQTRVEGVAWRVLAVDPEGPAARAGVRIDDVITGYFPDNGTSTALRELDTPYTFGLARFTLGVEGSFLGLQRDEQELRLFVEPEARPWGMRRAWRAGPATDSFFEFAPR